MFVIAAFLKIIYQIIAAPSTSRLENTFDIWLSIVGEFFFFLFYHRAKPDRLDGSVIPEEALQTLKDKQKKDISSNTFLNKAGNESSTKGFKNKADIWTYVGKLWVDIKVRHELYNDFILLRFNLESSNEVRRRWRRCRFVHVCIKRGEFDNVGSFLDNALYLSQDEWPSLKKH